jgi:enoyl-CoA hydratase/carnithine racemase
MTAVTPAGLVTYARDADSIGRITLRRAHKLNALNPTMLLALQSAFAAFDADESAAVAVLAGDGRAFCAGADTTEMPGLSVTPGEGVDLRTLPDVFLLRDRYKAVIAAAHGHVVGAGLRLVLLSDFAVCAETTRFRVPEIGHGLDGGPYWHHLQARAGDAFAADVVGTGRTWSGTEAADRGVVMGAAPDDELAKRVDELAIQLSGQPRAALRALVETRRISLRRLEMDAWTTRGRGLGWTSPAMATEGDA